jgi:hypothetical protein
MVSENTKVNQSGKSRGRPVGQPKLGGRKKGTPNKDKQELLDLILSTGCKHPIQGLAEIAKQSHAQGEFDLAKDCYKELAQYVASKRKAVEHSGHVETEQVQLVVVLDAES